jgi:hypothetical protein
MDLVKLFLLSIFLLSSPITVYCVYVLGYDRQLCAIANSYAFSIAMICLYVYPFIIGCTSWVARVNKAQMNWIVWLSVFTEIIFQIPHNLFVPQLNAVKGTSIEWPFYTYGLCDSRWDGYHEGVGLAPEVWLINVNDAVLGVAVALLFIFAEYKKRNCNAEQSRKASIMLGLVVLFRDATLWRETVEYLWDHHRKNYPYTTNSLEYRPHAIILLWLVNIIWLVAPCVTILWVYNLIFEPEKDGKKKGK